MATAIDTRPTSKENAPRSNSFNKEAQTTPSSTPQQPLAREPMSQDSVNRTLAWTAGIGICLAIVALFTSIHASRTSADNMTTITTKADKTDLATKADKSEIPNYGMRPNAQPTAGSTNTMDNGTNGNQGYGNTIQNGQNNTYPDRTGNNQPANSGTGGQQQ